jgi:cytochrome b6-f complex iron-sulfur subunit
MENSLTCWESGRAGGDPAPFSSEDARRFGNPVPLRHEEGSQGTDKGRREIIGKGLRGVFYCISALILAYPVFSFMTFRKVNRKTIVFHPKDQAPPASFKEGVYLVNPGTGFYALSARCTHLGCTLNFDPVSQRFRCPCHGSVFDLSGKRLAGPARDALKRVPIKMDKNKDVTVTLIL